MAIGQQSFFQGCIVGVTASIGKDDCWPMAIVAVRTKRTSWNVLVKHFGRSALSLTEPFV
jgi:hypothetical protein